jgi:putative ABC transport system permease protein
VRYFQTDMMRLFPASEGAYAGSDQFIAFVAVGFMSDLESHIDILEGRTPQPMTSSDDVLEVLIERQMVLDTGLQVGEEYVLYYKQPKTPGSTVENEYWQPVRIAGVWQARDPEQDYWIAQQSAYDRMFLVPEASYARLAQAIVGEVGQASWYLIADGDGVRSADVKPLLARIQVVRNKVASVLQNAELARSPEEDLQSYARTAQLLTVLLYVFSVPILGLVLYFVSLISAMIVQRQHVEVAMLRSRGTTTDQVIGIYLVEGLIVGAAAIVLGALLGERIAQWMGYSRSFLVLERRLLLPTVLSWENLRLGLLALITSLLTSILPAIRASRDTVVTYKQEQARTLRAPLWQRAWLDVLLLVPALYGYYLLRQRGTISILELEGEMASPFSNPYLFLVPVLFVFALALFTIRLFPLIMRLLAWVANAWRGIVPVLALRHLSRTARQYTGPLLLLILTLSLAVFTASMAGTLDQYTWDRMYYDIGADFRLIETGESTQGGGGSPFDGAGSAPAAAPDQGPDWLFLPVSEHLKIPGVRSAARVWTENVEMRLGGQTRKGRLMGIDRIDFADTAFFRPDFAPASMGALMNALAVRHDAVLVSREVVETGNIQVGDRIAPQVFLDVPIQVELTVSGVVDLFPSLYPEDGPFFIANLDYIFDSLGGMSPYDVWLRTDPSLDAFDVAEGAAALGIRVAGAYDVRWKVSQEQRRPDRQGVLGLLSVGFIASAFLTVLGFLIYSYISFRQRHIELGVLRAVGLAVGQMGTFLLVEQLTLIATGTVVGTGLGVLISRLFIPFFQVQDVQHPFTPPFVVQVAWNEIGYIYGVFGAMFMTAVIVLFVSLQRMRIFEAIKLGETT